MKRGIIMKRLFTVAMALVLLVSAFNCIAFAENNDSDIEAFVSVSVKGELVASYVKVNVADADGDGVITVSDVLYALHEANYDGGSDAGFATAMTEYGLSMTMLWGDTSGCFGYYLNNASCLSLSDEIKDGDYVYAFVYSDADTWSDSYSFFDNNTVSCNAGDNVTLTLSAAGYDAEWNPVTLPVANATIYVNGQATDTKTDADGKVTLVLDEAGSYVVSASCDDPIITPPVCIATVKAVGVDVESSGTDSGSVPAPGDTSDAYRLAVVAIVTACTIVFVCKKRAYEK